jgi:CubicO group peptidase (beta-lactamase class C family)
VVTADRLRALAERFCARTEGLAMSVAVVGADGSEQAATVGAPDGALFPSCSSFKPVVAAAVRSAARDGVLALAAPVASLPGGECAPDGWDGSLELLLSHLSGLAGDLYEVRIDGPSDEEAAALLLDRYLAAVPRTAPGRYWYSNLGYVLAGQVLSRAEGEPLLAVLRRRVLAPAGAEVATAGPTLAPPAVGAPPRANSSLRAAGGGIHLRALDLARTGAALAGGALRGLGWPGEAPAPTAALVAAGQHPAGGFNVDDRYGRRLLAHGGGHGAFGSAWIVDPDEGWSAAALFNHPAGHGLDLPAAVVGQARGHDPLRRAGPPPAPGWYLNAYAGVAEVAGGECRLNGRAVPGALADDGVGLVLNRTQVLIGALPYDTIRPPAASPAPELAGTWRSEHDELVVALDGGGPTVTSAARGESPALAVTPTTLACDHGVAELAGDALVLGGAYRFARA